MRYTQKVGETDAVKKIFDFLTSQQSVAENIKKKHEALEAFKI